MRFAIGFLIFAWSNSPAWAQDLTPYEWENIELIIEIENPQIKDIYIDDHHTPPPSWAEDIGPSYLDIDIDPEPFITIEMEE